MGFAFGNRQILGAGAFEQRDAGHVDSHGTLLHAFKEQHPVPGEGQFALFLSLLHQLKEAGYGDIIVDAAAAIHHELIGAAADIINDLGSVHVFHGEHQRHGLGKAVAFAALLEGNAHQRGHVAVAGGVNDASGAVGFRAAFAMHRDAVCGDPGDHAAQQQRDIAFLPQQVKIHQLQKFGIHRRNGGHHADGVGNVPQRAAALCQFVHDLLGNAFGDLGAAGMKGHERAHQRSRIHAAGEAVLVNKQDLQSQTCGRQRRAYAAGACAADDEIIDRGCVHMYLRFCVVEWMSGVSMIVQKRRSVKCCCGIAAFLRAACANKKPPQTSSSSWGGVFCLCNLVEKDVPKAQLRTTLRSSSWGGVFCLCNLVEKKVPKAQRLIRRQPCWSAWF